VSRSLALFGLAIVGQACALQLIDVRPYAAFQHYLPWEALWRQERAACVGVGGQTIAVAFLAWRSRARLATVLGPLLSLRAWIVLALAGFSLAVPAVSLSSFLGEVILAGALALVAALNLLLGVLAMGDRSMARVTAWVDARLTLRPSDTGERPWDRYLPVAVAVWVTIAAAAASYAVLERVPHIDDGVSNLFQARYFAAGRLFNTAPPDAAAFRMDLTVVDGHKWYGYAFPGWPAVLSIGVLAGVPWLVNPVLGGFTILIGHAWARRRWNRATANLAVLALAGSSWLIFMSAEFMGHPLTALLTMLVLLAVDRAIARGAGWVGWAAAAGIATGVLMLTRAFDGVLIAAAVPLIVLIDRRVRQGWLPTLVTGLFAAAVAALIFPYNQAVTGRANYPPHEAWADGRYGPGVDVLGFGPNVGIPRWPNLDPLPGHGPADVVLNLNKNLFMANVDLFGWAMGSLVCVWLALGLGGWQPRDRAMLGLIAAFIVGYSAFWFSGGPDLGPRYWYPLIIPFAVLTARGAQMLAAVLAVRGGVTHAGARVGVLVLVASVGAMVTVLPWRAATKHYRYRGIGGEVRALASAHHFEHALVFVRTAARDDYQSAFVLNPRTLDEPGTIYAIDAGPESRAAVVRRFADRPVWVIGRRDTASVARPFDVLEGPLAAGTIPR
jgi:hypothetical protein